VKGESAAQNHRSMQEQARLLIEREVRLHQPGAMERARSWRERMGRSHARSAHAPAAGGSARRS
jgi:hypothetical protein